MQRSRYKFNSFFVWSFLWATHTFTPKKLRLYITLGSCFSYNESRIKIIDKTARGKIFDYLRPKETFAYTIDRTYDITLIKIQFDGWFESSVHLWSKNNNMRKNFLLLQKTPLPSANISSFLLSSDSGIHTVF